MKPGINVGDAVIGVRVKESELKLDDVIVYKGDNNLIIHRLVDIEKKGKKNYYHTKGDSNNTEDDVDIRYEDIKGKVIFRIPYIAYPSIYFKEFSLVSKLFLLILSNFTLPSLLMLSYFDFESTSFTLYLFIISFN